MTGQKKTKGTHGKKRLHEHDSKARRKKWGEKGWLLGLFFLLPSSPFPNSISPLCDIHIVKIGGNFCCIVIAELYRYRTTRMEARNEADEYRELQLDFTPEMEIFSMLLERYLFKKLMTPRVDCRQPFPLRVELATFSNYIFCSTDGITCGGTKYFTRWHLVSLNCISAKS